MCEPLVQGMINKITCSACQLMRNTLEMTPLDGEDRAKFLTVVRSWYRRYDGKKKYKCTLS